jgi:hypothetical protein
MVDQRGWTLSYGRCTPVVFVGVCILPPLRSVHMRFPSEVENTRQVVRPRPETRGMKIPFVPHVKPVKPFKFFPLRSEAGLVCLAKAWGHASLGLKTLSSFCRPRSVRANNHFSSVRLHENTLHTFHKITLCATSGALNKI